MEQTETSTDVRHVVTPSLVLPASAGPAGTTAATTAAAFTPDVLAKLQELEERSAQHEKNLRPDNTTDSYAADWRQWEQFCALLELPVTAITPGSLTAFVEWLWWQPGWKKGTYTAPSTIDRRLSGVVVTGRTDHRLVLDKTVAARARRVLKAKVKEMEKTKETRGRGPAPALLAEHLRATVVAAPDTRLGIRDRSIGLTCFAIAGREHEVAFLRVRDFVETEHGMEVDVRVSKIKPRRVKVPFGSRPSSCPVRAWRVWKAEANLTDPDDFAYKPLHPRWHTVMDGGLDPETIGDVITRLGKWAELSFRPTGHSPRRGLATSSKRAGNDRKVIAKQGGWVENSAAMEGYFEEGDGWEENALVKVL
ncbi:integrase [Streptantibioticus rubrisoli]|uniref:Integrase n=1 Tax=Streptantibioticus rubrisoli TaxID=1387313 RepID=A0ABT1PKE6_9ACTN|nr:integrase [Streptantibioticus rubrisoli]MCQ4045837.1 integrase [Streptantibioticus rubrisoli]